MQDSNATSAPVDTTGQVESKFNKYLLVGGLPRSGTTLVETILGSHSRISIPPGDYPMAEKLAQGRSVRDFFDFQSKLQTWDRYEFKDFSSVWDLPSQTAFRRSVDLYADAMGKDVPGAKAQFT